MNRYNVTAILSKIVPQLLITFAMLSISIARAASITVTALPGDVGCDLIEAIDSANMNAAIGGCMTGEVGQDVITFASNLPRYEFENSAFFNASRGSSATPEITSEIKIVGPQSRLMVLAVSNFTTTRLFMVANSGDLRLENLSLQGGSQVSGYAGGAIRAAGNLTLDYVEIADSISDFGGGVWVQGGNAIIRNSLIRNNRAENQGGGIGLSRDSLATIYDSTISGNSASSFGGGISLAAGLRSSVTLYNTTITNNAADISGGGVSLFFNASVGQSDGNSAVLRNSIISGNTASIYSEVFVENQSSALNFDVRNNLLGTGGSTYGESVNSLIFLSSENNNIVLTQFFENTPLRSILEPLKDNGGKTMTHALVANSPAIDKGLPVLFNGGPLIFFLEPGCRGEFIGFTLPDYRADQRGVARPINSECDIGAYEYEPPDDMCYVVRAKNNNVVTFCL